MKKYFKIVIFFLMLATLILPASTLWAAGTTSISVSVPAQAIAAGSQFSISIVVQPDRPIAGAQFSLAFDPSLVTVNSVTEGDLLKQDGASTFFAAGKIDNDLGTISVVSGAIITPGSTVSSPGTLAVINLAANPLGGTCSFTLSGVVAGDINGESVPISTTNATCTITGAPGAVNQPPELKEIGNKSIRTWSQLNFSISATDAEKDKLTYSASNLPAGASFRASTRTFYWRPTSGQVGTYPGVHFEVTDGKSSDFEDITITVTTAVSNGNRNAKVTYNGTATSTSSPVITQVFTAAENSVQIKPPVAAASGDGVVEAAGPANNEINESIAETRFTYSPIVVSPSEAFIGETVSVSTMITNAGDISGSVEVKLAVNNQIEESQVVNLSAGETCEVVFPISQNEAGIYPVDINGIGAAVSFKEPPIVPTEPATPPQIVETEFGLSLLVEIIGGALAAMWIIAGIILLYRRRMLRKI